MAGTPSAVSCEFSQGCLLTLSQEANVRARFIISPLLEGKSTYALTGCETQAALACAGCRVPRDGPVGTV